jgi:hypothetical protein
MHLSKNPSVYRALLKDRSLSKMLRLIRWWRRGSDLLLHQAGLPSKAFSYYTEEA